MPRYSKSSLDRLSGCHPDLVLIFAEAIKHTDIKILEGVRSADRQYELYKQGRSKCDGFKRKFSHQVKSDGYSWAVDAVPYPVDFADTARFKALAAVVLVSIHAPARGATPTPTTGLGAKLYKILEVFALVFGRAKDR